MMMSFIMATLMAMPVQAQDVIEGEVVEPQDDTEVTDSTMLDSLAADTLKLPWPESVQVGIGKLLESKMFETSQVGIMVWDMDADSCIYKQMRSIAPHINTVSAASTGNATKSHFFLLLHLSASRFFPHFRYFLQRNLYGLENNLLWPDFR